MHAVRVDTNAFFRTKHDGKLVYGSTNLNKTVLTGQLVVAQAEFLHSRAPPELRGNVACAARMSFLVLGTLVYRSINLSKKVRTGQSVGEKTEVLHGRAEAEFRRNVACAARRSFLVRGTLVYQTGEMSTKLTYRSAGYPRGRRPA